MYEYKKKLSQQQKYNKILKSFVPKAAYISNLPQDNFDFVFDQVEKMDDCFSDGKLFFLIPSDESIDIHSLINNPNDKDVLGDVVSVSSLEDNDEVHENIASVLLSPSLQNPEDIIINNEIEKTIFMPSCLQDDDLDQSNNIKISEALENLDMIIEREEQRKQDAIDDKENIDFEKIRSLKLPARMKRQGKPRKSDLSVIGLSKKGNKSKKKHFDIYNDKVKAIGIKSIPKFAEDIGKGTPIITNSQMEFINFIINEKINAGDTKPKNLGNRQITYKKLSNLIQLCLKKTRQDGL
ncbi:uncharacterized protein LOC135927767 [Gordionus sp. m RMFG-2023]|uniref:uncharacterized protein LOC135927767 n=1 Tax=Gordionus sp. m RMFG-2023 TaxID=3053472 RepID=UPI0031FD954E